VNEDGFLAAKTPLGMTEVWDVRLDGRSEGAARRFTEVDMHHAAQRRELGSRTPGYFSLATMTVMSSARSGVPDHSSAAVIRDSAILRG
jgi:hypothetical protein